MNDSANGANAKPGLTSSFVVITEAAGAKFRAFRSLHGTADRWAVRITVRPEAHLREKYALEFTPVEQRGSDDVLLRSGDLLVLLDPRSALLLAGTEVDFVEGMWRSGFRFTSPDRLRLMSDPLAARVQEVIDAHIQPMLAAHAGSVTLLDVRDGRAYVEFGGGCQGCGLAPATLKDGVRARIVANVSGIYEVIDATDHAAGEHPYYAPGDGPAP